MRSEAPPRLIVTFGMTPDTLRALSAESLEALRKAAIRGGTFNDVERVCEEMARRKEGAA